MAANSIIKRYWKLSLMVYPDKCPYPEANQAFIKLNKAFKNLQDPVKRKAMDDKIDDKEEKERFKLELKAMREAAEVLASMDVKVERRRESVIPNLYTVILKSAHGTSQSPICLKIPSHQQPQPREDLKHQ
ncbi:hypothetical protein L1887_36029 [Cichorium endivia]|nr:hypothetical protein L1887_36029 [Cichorium endivia]